MGSSAFPCGVAPGFDSTHPVAAKARFSAVALGTGNFVNVLTGLIGTPSNAPTGTVDGVLGPVVACQLTPSVAKVTFASQYVAADTNCTIAAILRFGTAGVLGAFQVGNGSSSYILSSDGGPALKLDVFGGTGVLSTIVLSANAPYFLAASTNGAATVFLAKRLDTGKVLTDIGGATSTPTGGGSTYNIGNLSNNTGGAVNKIAAVAYTSSFSALPRLLQWADDPWSFWYPGIK